jgi:hypothetical protein
MIVILIPKNMLYIRTTLTSYTDFIYRTRVAIEGKYMKLYKKLKPLNYTRQKPPRYTNA